MTDELVVRAYNVGFGDAVLVSIPEKHRRKTVVRHLLIDVGNLLAGKGNENSVFNDVVDDISRITGGEVDLYVMSHEHLDHVQGLLAASSAGHPLTARYAWLTGSARPTYYDDHPDAKVKKLEDEQSLRAIASELAAADEPDPWLAMMLRNNGVEPEGALGLTTGDYVEHLRHVAPPEKTSYVDCDADLTGTHPFTEATLTVLAPEEDTSTYYGRRKTNPALAATAGPAATVAAAPPAPIVPPVGVDTGAFLDLVRARNHPTRTAILEIDQAANNTSVVLMIEWCGWRLLFPGDAEERSWLTMNDKGVLEPVHLVKISHHGSENGTVGTVLDVVMPVPAPDDRPRHAIVSTHDGDWKSVPDEETLRLYGGRATLHDTRQADRGKPVEIRFERR